MIGRPADHSNRLADGEYADAEALERDLALDPEGTMRRRDFLARTAAVAGSASFAATMGADQLVAEAARRGNRHWLPSPRNLPIDTFVVLMMENRSFDHYFGWHPRADARNTGLRYPDGNGNRIPTHRLTPDFQGCGHPDPDHGWSGGRWQWNGGRTTGSSPGTHRGPAATSSRSATTSSGTCPSFHTPRMPTRSTTGGSARSWPPRTRTGTTNGAPRTAGRSRTSSR